MITKDTINRIVINGIISDEFAVGNCLKYGDPWSTTLFNLLLEKVLRPSEIRAATTKNHQYLVYADMARCKRKLFRVVRNMEGKTRKMRVIFNKEKLYDHE